MKLTKRQLQRIIQEEFEKLLEYTPEGAYDPNPKEHSKERTEKGKTKAKRKIHKAKAKPPVEKRPYERDAQKREKARAGRAHGEGAGISLFAPLDVGGDVKKTLSKKIPDDKILDLEEDNNVNDLVQEIYKRFLRGN